VNNILNVSKIMNMLFFQQILPEFKEYENANELLAEFALGLRFEYNNFRIWLEYI
jgi:hypothetical protein